MARILLIDDDDTLRTMLRLALTNSGHTVTEARNGNEGLRLFRSANADLVITDLVMPETEGLEVLMELRKREPLLKIIAISGGGRFNTTDYLEIAKQMGAAKVFMKPFASELLLAAIDDLLHGAAKPSKDS